LRHLIVLGEILIHLTGYTIYAFAHVRTSNLNFVWNKVYEERWDGVMWTGLVWLRIWTGGDLL
jgi:hypothetical protein